MKRLAVALATGIGLFATSPAFASEAPCDRACLYGHVDAWLAAVKRHDAAAVELAPGFRYTENAETVAPGEGLFRTVTAYTPYEMRAADPKTGAVAVIGEAMEGDKPVTFATRLKIVGGKIADAETVIGRSFATTHPSMPATSRPAFSTAIPAGERLSRAEMAATVNRNFDNLLKNDGSHFADDCQRIENHMPMSGNPQLRYPITPIPGKPVPAFGSMGCRAQVEAHLFDTLDAVTPRRILVIDEERQIVFGVFSLRFYGRTECNEIPDYGRTCPANPRGPISLLSAEMLGVRGGRLHEVEVIFTRRPYDAGQGWPEN